MRASERTFFKISVKRQKKLEREFGEGGEISAEKKEAFPLPNSRSWDERVLTAEKRIFHEIVAGADGRQAGTQMT